MDLDWQRIRHMAKWVCIFCFEMKGAAIFIKLLDSYMILITGSSLVIPALLNYSYYIMIGSKSWTREVIYRLFKGF